MRQHAHILASSGEVLSSLLVVMEIVYYNMGEIVLVDLSVCICILYMILRKPARTEYTITIRYYYWNYVYLNNNKTIVSSLINLLSDL